MKPVEVVLRNINVLTKLDTKILHDINVVFPKGELTAIMGASGAGKTTLMNCMSKINTSDLNVTGEMLISGKDYGTNVSAISAYVQQSDLFFGEITPKQHLIFNATMLGLGKHVESRVNEVITDMNLTPFMDTKIGSPKLGWNLSESERKRLSFATKILVRVPLLFCDEPTTGLDAKLAANVVSSLRKIANKGTTVLCTIHTPASQTFEKFDNLLLLAQGKIVCFGSRSSTKDFFKHELEVPCPDNYNPADHYINATAVRPENAHQCIENINKYADVFLNSFTQRETVRYIKSIEREEVFDPIKQWEKPTFSQQFSMLLWRSAIEQWSNTKVLGFRIANAICLAVLLGLMYLKSPGTEYVGFQVKSDTEYCKNNGTGNLVPAISDQILDARLGTQAVFIVFQYFYF